MIYLVSLHTDRMVEFNHIKRELLERFDLVSMGQILIIDFPGDARALRSAVLEVAPLPTMVLVASVGDWATRNMPDAEQWLSERISRRSS